MYTVLLRAHDLYMYNVESPKLHVTVMSSYDKFTDSSMSCVLQQNVEKFIYMIYTYVYGT